MAKREIKYLPVEILIPYARNSRTHSDAQIAQVAASIREFGWTNPVLVDSENGIVAGHGGVLAARKLGIKEVPCIELSDLSDVQKRAYIIADNKLALNAGWDEDLLALEIADLYAAGFDLSLTGLDEDELSDLVLDDSTVGLTDEDASPDIQERVVTAEGDIWALDQHRLMCGDSTRIDSVEALMGG